MNKQWTRCWMTDLTHYCTTTAVLARAPTSSFLMWRKNLTLRTSNLPHSFILGIPTSTRYHIYSYIYQQVLDKFLPWNMYAGHKQFLVGQRSMHSVMLSCCLTRLKVHPSAMSSVHNLTPWGGVRSVIQQHVHCLFILTLISTHYKRYSV